MFELLMLSAVTVAVASHCLPEGKSVKPAKKKAKSPAINKRRGSDKFAQKSRSILSAIPSTTRLQRRALRWAE